MAAYWQEHDISFLKHANLSRFNSKILDLDLKSENHFFAQQLQYAPNKSKMLDIGAYKGDTCIPVAKELKENGRADIEVIAFEPNKTYCDQINETALQEKINLKCIQTALSDKTQPLFMKTDEGSGTMYDTMFTGEEVKSQPLDHFGFENVALMKVDVEGHEDQVLRGSKQTLIHTDKLYVEMWNDHHYNERHPNHDKGSHNERILNEIQRCQPLQKIEKNVLFQCE
tara:strand:- start:252 stop:932 length:681 start_codon:yes stop_codon:yes gene_type:complete